MGKQKSTGQSRMVGWGSGESSSGHAVAVGSARSHARGWSRSEPDHEASRADLYQLIDEELLSDAVETMDSKELQRASRLLAKARKRVDEEIAKRTK